MPSATSQMSTADELEKLHRLHKEGVLSDAEYERAKKTAIETEKSVGAKIDEAVNDVIKDVPKYCMFMHLSQFLGYVLPVLGLAVPIVMWVLRRNDSPDIHRHGINIANWIITELIYLVIFSILAGFIIGIPLLGALVVCSVAFPVIGAIKARDGKIWTYPLTIPFLKPDEI